MIYDFSVKKSDGSDLKLSDLKGKVIMEECVKKLL